MAESRAVTLMTGPPCPAKPLEREEVESLLAGERDVLRLP